MVMVWLETTAASSPWRILTTSRTSRWPCACSSALPAALSLNASFAVAPAATVTLALPTTTLWLLGLCFFALAAARCADSTSACTVTTHRPPWGGHVAVSPLLTTTLPPVLDVEAPAVGETLALMAGVVTGVPAGLVEPLPLEPLLPPAPPFPPEPPFPPVFAGGALTIT